MKWKTKLAALGMAALLCVSLVACDVEVAGISVEGTKVETMTAEEVLQKAKEVTKGKQDMTAYWSMAADYSMTSFGPFSYEFVLQEDIVSSYNPYRQKDTMRWIGDLVPAESPSTTSYMQEEGGKIQKYIQGSDGTWFRQEDVFEMSAFYDFLSEEKGKIRRNMKKWVDWNSMQGKVIYVSTSLPCEEFAEIFVKKIPEAQRASFLEALKTKASSCEVRLELKIDGRTFQPMEYTVYANEFFNTYLDVFINPQIVEQYAEDYPTEEAPRWVSKSFSMVYHKVGDEVEIPVLPAEAKEAILIPQPE